MTETRGTAARTPKFGAERGGAGRGGTGGRAGRGRGGVDARRRCEADAQTSGWRARPRSAGAPAPATTPRDARTRAPDGPASSFCRPNSGQPVVGVRLRMRAGDYHVNSRGHRRKLSTPRGPRLALPLGSPAALPYDGSLDLRRHAIRRRTNDAHATRRLPATSRERQDPVGCRSEAAD